MVDVAEYSEGTNSFSANIHRLVTALETRQIYKKVPFHSNKITVIQGTANIKTKYHYFLLEKGEIITIDSTCDFKIINSGQSQLIANIDRSVKLSNDNFFSGGVKQDQQILNEAVLGVPDTAENIFAELFLDPGIEYEITETKEAVFSPHQGAMDLVNRFSSVSQIAQWAAEDPKNATELSIALAEASVILPKVNLALPSMSLPDKAPRLWKDRPADERKMNPAEFIRKVYAPWLGQGLARHHVGELDKMLGIKYSNWIRKDRYPGDAITEFAKGNPYGRLDDGEAGRRHREGVKASQAKKAAKMSQAPTPDIP